MTRVNLAEAKARLSELIEVAQAGEEVVISRRNVPVARLVRVRAPKAKPVFGKLRGNIRLAADFDAPLADFEGYTGRS